MNYYIDCGTHLGDGFAKHVEKLNITQNWKCFTFEANPYTYQVFKNERNKDIVPKQYEWVKWPNVTFYNKAVWIYDGEIDFYCSSVDVTENLKIASDYIEAIEAHDKDVKNGNLITDHQRQSDPTDGSSTIFVNHFKNFLHTFGNSLQKHLKWDTKQTIECFDFSSWLKNTVTKNDFVVCKMDIEGAEFEVLKKCIDENTLQLINVLDIEWHPFDNIQYNNEMNYIINYCHKNNIKIKNW